MLLLVCLGAALAIAGAQGAEQAASPGGAKVIAVERPAASLKVDFQSDILPVLKNNCLACHNQTKAKADLILETPATILKGGESGPAVVPGKGGESLLLLSATHEKEPFMPPRDNKAAARDLTPRELGLLRQWIDQGATGEVRTAAALVWQAPPTGSQPVWSVALTSDGQMAAVGRGNQILLHQVPTGTTVARLVDTNLPVRTFGKTGAAQRDSVLSLAFSPDGNRLAAGDFRSVRIWKRERSTNAAEWFPAVNPGTVRAVARDGRSLAMVETNGQVRLWRHGETMAGKAVLGSLEEARWLGYSPDGLRLAGVGRSGEAKVWRIDDGRLLGTNLVSAPTGLGCWLPDSSGLALAGEGGRGGLYKLIEGKYEIEKAGELNGAEGMGRTVASGGTGTNLAVAIATDQTLMVWGARNGAMEKRFEGKGKFATVAVAGDGARLVAAEEAGSAQLLDAGDGRVIAELKGERHLLEDLAGRERDVAFAAGEVTYQKGVVEAAEKREKLEKDRVAKATEAKAAADKGLAEKQKLTDTARQTKTDAEKALAAFEAERKAALESYKAAEVEAAKASKAARDLAGADSASATTNDKAGELAKAIEVLAQKSFAAGQLKPAFDKITAEGPGREKALKEAVESTGKALAEAEKNLARAQLTASTAGTEFQLGTQALVKAGENLASAKDAQAKAEAYATSAKAALEASREAAKAGDSPMVAVCFSGDQQLLATLRANGLAQVWSGVDGSAVETYADALKSSGSGAGLKAGAGPGVIGFIGDDQMVMVRGHGPILRAELAERWHLERVIGSPDDDRIFADRVMALAFSPDGALLATGGGDPSRSGEIKVWEVGSGKLAASLDRVHSDVVLSLEFSPDGRLLASGSADRFVRVTDWATQKVLKTLEGHLQHVLGVSWKRNGRVLASAGADNIIKIWDLVAGERRKNIEGFSKEVTSVRFLGDAILATSGDGQVRLLKENGEEIRSCKGAGDFVNGGAGTVSGTTVIGGGQDGVLRVWNGASGELRRSFPAPNASGSLNASAGKP